MKHVFVEDTNAIMNFSPLKYWCYNGVTRSKKTESDRDVRKAKNVFTNLRFCGKRKDCTKQLTSILKL